jgi:hypothetical protein
MSPNPTKLEARRLATMVESRLIGYRHYFPWADRVIADSDEPPAWIINLAAIRYYAFVHSEPFEHFNEQERSDQYVACLFLRYRRGEISWATFLNDAGSVTDAANGPRECEYFYLMLNDLEDREFSKDVEAAQAEKVEREFEAALATIRPLYEDFVAYFREYVRTRT